MNRFVSLSMVVAVTACSHGAKDVVVPYAVGTRVLAMSVALGYAEDCEVISPDGVVVGDLAVKAGAFQKKCGGRTRTEQAAVADSIRFTAPDRVKVGDEIRFSFELARGGQSLQDVRELGMVTLADACKGVIDEPRYGGAQDTGHTPFEEAAALAAGTCEATVTIDWSQGSWPAEAGPPPPTLRASKTITVVAK